MGDGEATSTAPGFDIARGELRGAELGVRPSAAITVCGIPRNPAIIGLTRHPHYTGCTGMIPVMTLR